MFKLKQLDQKHQPSSKRDAPRGSNSGSDTSHGRNQPGRERSHTEESTRYQPTSSGWLSKMMAANKRQRKPSPESSEAPPRSRAKTGESSQPKLGRELS